MNQACCAHPQPHYFCQLDVVATVRNLMREAPDFWDSPELRRTLEDGRWMGLDYPFCTQVCMRWGGCCN